MDLLTQRLSPELGPMLAGCDALALDALNKDHPALDIIEPPIVYCDRGFGASVLREGIPLPDGSRNPLPVIQIPYSKFREKYNLTSIIHEAGHEVIVRLELVNVLPKVVKAALQDAHAPDNISDLYALWVAESAPDYWVFCNAGVAQPLSIMEIMSLPRKYVMRISLGDPHPPPYIRVLLSFEWCRHQWGKGDWDDWETEWKRRYPIENASEGELLELATRYIPVVSKALFNTRFKILGDKSIPSLFDLDSIAPNKLEMLAKMADSGIVMLTGLNPCAQLALFWVLRYKKHLGEEIIDRVMTKWLIRLGKQRK